MHEQLVLWPKDYGDVGGNYKTAISPRVFLVIKGEEGPRVLLVRFKNTNWFGLPGGRMNENEVLSGVNLISPQWAFPAIQREVLEETNVDIGGLRESLQFLGLVDLTGINNVTEVATYFTTPIYFCYADQSIIPNKLDKNARLLRIDERGTVPLFPDARLAFQTYVRRKEVGEFLGGGGMIYFQTSPQPMILNGPPSWLVYPSESDY